LKNQSLAEVDLIFVIMHLIQHGHIVVFQTQEASIASLHKEVQAAVEKISQIPPLGQLPKKPTFIFFLTRDDFNFSSSGNLDAFHQKAMAKALASPEAITQEKFDDWVADIRGDNQAFDEFLDQLGQVLVETHQIDFAQMGDKCPSVIIEKICVEFKIPHKQILDIT